MSIDYDEPDIFGNSETVSTVQADLTLDEYDFEAKYKATKRQYVGIQAAIKALQEAATALQDESPLEIDADIEENIVFLVEDLMGVLDQMHTASEWAEEKD
jgi:hypothetical protein